MTEAYPEVVFPRVTVLTPNVVEMDRLAQKVAGKETLGKDEVIQFAIANLVEITVGSRSRIR